MSETGSCQLSETGSCQLVWIELGAEYCRRFFGIVTNEVWAAFGFDWEPAMSETGRRQLSHHKLVGTRDSDIHSVLIMVCVTLMHKFQTRSFASLTVRCASVGTNLSRRARL